MWLISCLVVSLMLIGINTNANATTFITLFSNASAHSEITDVSFSGYGIYNFVESTNLLQDFEVGKS